MCDDGLLKVLLGQFRNHELDPARVLALMTLDSHFSAIHIGKNVRILQGSKQTDLTIETLLCLLADSDWDFDSERVSCDRIHTSVDTGVTALSDLLLD